MIAPPASATRKRLGILTEMDAWSASTRYRALQHVPRLSRRFASVEVSLPGDSLLRTPGRLGQLRYFGTHAERYARRAVGLRASVEQADALLVQRGLYVMGPGLIVQGLRRFSGRLVFDLDDAVFSVSPSLARKSALAQWLYGPQQALELMRRADAIVVSTKDLADLLPPGLPAPTILPTVPDPAAYQVVRHDERAPAVVGWAGTVGGIGYLDPLAGVFERLAASGVARLMVVSSHAWAGPSEFRRWRLEEESSVFGEFSIGIMPLPATDYTRAKGGFKLLQYMAAGLPVVASPIGINRALIERSQAGFLADSPAEWEEALRALSLDPDLRTRMGARGRAFLERYADLDDQAQTLARLLCA